MLKTLTVAAFAAILSGSAFAQAVAPDAVQPYAAPPPAALFAATVLPAPAPDANSDCDLKFGLDAAESDDLMTFTLPYLAVGGKYSGPTNVRVFSVDDDRARVFTGTSKVQLCSKNGRNWLELDVEAKDGVIVVPLQRGTNYLDFSFIVGGSRIDAVIPASAKAVALRSN